MRLPAESLRLWGKNPPAPVGTAEALPPIQGCGFDSPTRYNLGRSRIHREATELKGMATMAAKTGTFFLLAVAGILAATSASCGQDAAPTWPQWRGPSRTAQVASGPAWPDRLNEDNLQQVWRVELGRSYSGPIVAADRVFVTESTAEKEIAQALDRRTGKPLWSHPWKGALSVPFFAWENGNWIRATPAYDGENLYVAGMRDVLVCLDAANGEEKWRVDFVQEFKSPLPAFGFVCSPLVEGDFVYVQAGGGFCKLDKRTGKVLWRKLVDGGGMNGSAFSSPVLEKLDGKTQLLVQTREELAGVDPDSGAKLWSREIPAFRGMNILTPTVWREKIFTSAYGGRSFLLQVDANDDGDAWKIDAAWDNKLQGYMSSPVVIDDHLYIHLKNRRFACVRLEDGEIKWITTPFGKYWSMVAQGNRILALDQRGDLLLIDADPQEFKLVDKLHVSDESTWAHLAVCGDEIYVRDLKGLTVYRWTK